MKYKITKEKSVGELKANTLFIKLKIKDISLDLCFSKRYAWGEVDRGYFSYIIKNEITDNWFEAKAHIYRYDDVYLVIKQDWYMSWSKILETQHSPDIGGLLYKTFREAKASIKKDIKELLKENLLKEKNNG